jgi:hypothetical protein
MNSDVDYQGQANRDSRGPAVESELDAAYDDALRAELTEITVAGDAVLGSLVDGLVEIERLKSKAAGYQVAQVYRMLTERLPLTLAGLAAGDFSYRHAKAVVAHARTLPDGLHAAFEAAVLPSASVTLGAWNRADEIARALHALPGETRTLTQLRSDVMADLLLDGTVRDADGERPEFSIRPTVTITVPALAMLGVKDKNGNPELPTLDGYGPIDLATATRLAGAAKSWLRVLTHPETGTWASTTWSYPATPPSCIYYRASAAAASFRL